MPLDFKTLVSQSFSPHISVTSSVDANELCGAYGASSFLELLKPYGEKLDGRIKVKELTVNDFSVKFVPPPGAEPIQYTKNTIDEFVEKLLSQGHDRAYLGILESLISKLPVSPFETFAHPVAGIIATSSKNDTPTDSLSRLYKDTNETPDFVNKEYLRYYVLIHDPDTDLNESLKLFEKMKRHFGLQCHLVKIGEEGAIDNLVGDMVRQSVIPFMQRCIDTWTEVYQSRRGITGRLFGKYFSGGSSKSSNNYQDGKYHLESSESQLRRLADYSFMLRDYSFAYNVYEILKKDHTNDKAWSYLASSQEMCLFSYLLSHDLIRPDHVEAMLDTSTYNYATRSSLPLYALRSILLGCEQLLLKNSPKYSHLISKWLLRIQTENFVGPIALPLVLERVGYASKGRRKHSFWNLLAAREWNDKVPEIEVCLNECSAVYEELEWTKEEGRLYGRLVQIVEDSIGTGKTVVEEKQNSDNNILEKIGESNVEELTTETDKLKV